MHLHSNMYIHRCIHMTTSALNGAYSTIYLYLKKIARTRGFEVTRNAWLGTVSMTKETCSTPRSVQHAAAISQKRQSTRNKTGSCHELCCACSWVSRLLSSFLIFVLVDVSLFLSFVFVLILSCAVRSEKWSIALPVCSCCGSQWCDWSDRRRKVPERVQEHVPEQCPENLEPNKTRQEPDAKLLGHTIKVFRSPLWGAMLPRLVEHSAAAPVLSWSDLACS